MFKALWIKHWVQLRTLRWVGFGLCVVLPFFLWTGAAAAKRGWFSVPLGDYSLTTLFGEALPGFAALLWAFLGVLLASQTFAGDRADGTDRFLLERPVSRKRVWIARVLASTASTIWVAAASTVYMFALVGVIDDGSVANVFSNMGFACAVGVGLALLGTLGGMAGGEMARTPMQAMMIGLVLGAAPIGVMTFLSSAFRFVLITPAVHLAYVVTPLLLVALVVASYRAGCFGEPSGRGRVKRGVAVLAIGFVLTPALFAAAAPFVLRATVFGASPFGVAATADRAILVGGGYGLNGGWIVDTAKGKRTRFLPPPVIATDMKPDGTLAAVVHQSGTLGSAGPATLELIDATGRTAHSIEIETDHYSLVRDVVWAGDLVLVLEWAGARDARITVVHPEAGVSGRIEVEGGKGQSWNVQGPTPDGTVFLHRLVSAEPRRYELAPLDFETFSIGEPVLIEDDDLPTFARKLLSPSGRYWARVIYTREAHYSYVLDLQTGTRVDYPRSVIEGWLEGDRLVRLENELDTARLFVETLDGDAVFTESFPAGVGARISPDGTRFLVTQRSSDRRFFVYPFYWGTDVSGLDQLHLCDASGCADLESLVGGLQQEYTYLAWGGPTTLLATTARATAVAPAEPGASWKAVLGDWD